jgi:hypothetical protein
VSWKLFSGQVSEISFVNELPWFVRAEKGMVGIGNDNNHFYGREEFVWLFQDGIF